MALMATLISTTALNHSRELTVHGIITDESSAPIAGATVCEEETKSCTITGIDGSFTILIHSQKAVLVVTAIGFD
jgi:hypothetical protein